MRAREKRRLPVRRFSSKLCATLVLSRGLRVDGAATQAVLPCRKPRRSAAAPMVVAMLWLLSPASAQTSTESAALRLEAKIPLGAVRGRIDHMAVDLKRQRLFVAELGNDSVGIIDLASQKLLRTIPGFKGPQGVGYEPSTDMLYVANAGDGSVRLFEGGDYKAAGRIELG